MYSSSAFGALQTYPSKSFDYLPHKLLIAKLSGYGFEIGSLRIICDYLSNREKRVKVNNTYSLWGEILYGIPQGPILGALLFFLCGSISEKLHI